MGIVDDTTPTTKYSPSDRTTWYAEGVTHVRRWASDAGYFLSRDRAQIQVGSSSRCDWQLNDDSGQLSRVHGLFTPIEDTWQITDVESTNGISVDGMSISTATLQPGAKIKLGGVTLVAETPSFRVLRSLVCRALGWAPERLGIVDEALQTLRDFATQRIPLMLYGHEDLFPIAERLHRAMLGPQASFHVFKKGEIASAVDAAKEGTLCLPTASYEMIDAVGELVRDKGASAPRLLFCKKKRTETESSVVPAKAGRHSVISIPTLSTRREEVPRICAEVITDILAREGFRSHRIREPELQHFRKTPLKYITELEDSICRLVAIRNRGIFQAAKTLGLSHSTLSEWLGNWERSVPEASASDPDRS